MVRSAGVVAAFVDVVFVGVVFVGVVFVGVVFVGCQPQPPTDACRHYVACQKAFDDAAGLDPVDTAAYERDGACWTSPEFSEACDADCEDALVDLASAADAADLDVEECVVDS